MSYAHHQAFSRILSRATSVSVDVACGSKHVIFRENGKWTFVRTTPRANEQPRAAAVRALQNAFAIEVDAKRLMDLVVRPYATVMAMLYRLELTPEEFDSLMARNSAEAASEFQIGNCLPES